MEWAILGLLVLSFPVFAIVALVKARSAQDVQ